MYGMLQQGREMSYEKWPGWRDQWGMIHLEPKGDGERSENAILFTITNWFLNKKDMLQINSPEEAIIEHEFSSDVYVQAPWMLSVAGHDNITAIVTALTWIDSLTLEKIKILPHYPHPRDIIYIAYVQERWWSYPLLPILWFIFLWMALTKYKVRGNEKKIKTDTEILYWIRLQLPPKYKFIHWSSPPIKKLLKKRFGERWVHEMMCIYFKHPSHPNKIDSVSEDINR